MNEGDSHRRQQRIMQPMFHRDAVSRYAETMVEEIAHTEARWRWDWPGRNASDRSEFRSI